MPADPYRYFRIEAEELLEGLGEGLLALEKGADPQLLKRLLRYAHTFKGASRVVKQTEIGDLAHQIEDWLTAHAQSGRPVDRASVDHALELLDRIRRLVAGLAIPHPAKTVSQAPKGELLGGGAASSRVTPSSAPATEPTIRIAVRELDALLENALETRIAAAALQRAAALLPDISADARELARSLRGRGRTSSAGSELVEQLAERVASTHQRMAEHLNQIFVELSELHGTASKLRLVPARILIADLERVTRDAARALDKAVEIRWSGAETHVDAHVLAGLHKALVHVVRNSVAHGIESHAQRLGSGKPQVGVIDIAFERRGHRVLVRCTDDGRGLDLEAIKRVVVSRGLISPEQATTIDQVALEELLLSGGVSTSPTVTDVSGRGVGLEAVRHAVQALKGELKLHSRVGRGTTVEILVPLSLSAMPALAVHCERTTALIPLDSVRQALRVTPSDVVRQEDGERVVVGGQVIPFLPLARALDRSDARASESHSAVILEAQGQLAAIGVDKLGAARSVVVRAIPEHADLNPVVSGAAFNDEGNIDLVLAPPALIRAAMDAEPLTPPVQAERPRILVIDDSLTTRMLEQSILEAAGYQVDLAVSGEEGLAKARTTRYGLFIVDVEMPGMSGFEFVSTVKADAELGATPCILVTSRAAASDRRRGKEVGARAYIVKSEFNQAELLETVARFLDD